MVTPKGVEATIRVTDGREVFFLLNHKKESERIILNDDYRDLLDDKEYQTGNSIEIGGRGVYVLLRQNKEMKTYDSF